MKKNSTLIIGLAIPILMIIAIASSIYLPSLFIQPKHNFLYTDYGGYRSQYKYLVSDNKLVRELNQNRIPQPQVHEDGVLYIYDVVKDEAREISFEESQELNIDPSDTSPDGFEVVYGSKVEGFLFLFWTDTDYSTRYLKGRGVVKKLDLREQSTNSGFNFIGWVI